MKKGQTVSLDTMLAVLLFVVAVIMLFYLSGPASKNRQSERLESESRTMPATLSSQQNDSGSFVEGTKVNDEKIEQVSNLSYEVLKAQLGLESDFCIYFEDEQGNLVPIKNKVGIGSPLVNISGKSCNESLG